MHDAADMDRFLGPVPSVNAIVDKLDSSYGSVSTFDVRDSIGSPGEEVSL